MEQNIETLNVEPQVPPVVTPSVTPSQAPVEPRIVEPTVEPKKKGGKGPWMALAILFLLTSIVLGFLYLTKSEMMTVVFVDKDNNIKVEKVEKGSLVAKKDGADTDFLGWYYNDTEFDFETKINQDYVLVAKYDERNLLTVTFNTDGGSAVEAVKVKENSKLSEPVKPTKEGYLFNEWTLDGVTYDFNTPVTKDIELKATWRVSDNTVMVRFNSDGGSSISSQKVAVGATAKKPSNPTRSGYTFKEWTLNGTTYDFTKPVNEEITLKATWTEKAKVTLSFDSNGGSAVQSKKVYVQEKVGTLPTPTRSGYVFSKWELNGNTFNASSMISKNTTVKAVWKTVDQANLEKALALIKSSYDVTQDGQKITISGAPSGCTITHDEIKTSSSTITFHVTCGSEKKDKTAKANVKIPTYKYTVTDSGNMVNSYVKISGVTSGTLCLKSNQSECFEISNGQAIVENKFLTNNPVFLMKKSGDNTTYTVTKK